MKRNIALGLIGWLIASLCSYKSPAQDIPAPPPSPAMQKESQEIIIRKKGDKDVKVMVEISADKVLLNGKPLAEFNEEGVTINNRKVIVRDGNRIMIDFDGKMKDIDEKLKELEGADIDFNFDMDNIKAEGSGKPYTFLGVSTEKTEGGVKITDVTKDSPAEKAGLQKGDIIYKIEDNNVSTAQELSKIVRAMKEGDKIKIYYLRNGKKNDLKATLGARKEVSVRKFIYQSPKGNQRSFSIPPMPPMPPMPPGAPDMFDGEMFGRNEMPRHQKLGLKIQDTEEGNGIKVLDVEPASAASVAGVQKDDIITEIGGEKVKNTDEAREQLRENRDKSSYEIKVKRNGTEKNFTVKIPKKLKTANL